MLLFLLFSVLSLSTVDSAAITLAQRLTNGAQISHLPPNLTTTAFNISLGVNSRPTSAIVDPRFTYDKLFLDEVLDKNSVYMTALIGLVDLSTLGWTTTLTRERQYSMGSYGDLEIRIQAKQTPSILQYRHAIWGLYRAIQEVSANGFRGCYLTLFWNPGAGAPSQKLGGVLIIHGSPLGIDNSTSIRRSLRLAMPTEVSPPELALFDLNNSTLTTQAEGTTDLKVEISLLGRPLDIDAVFQIVYTSIVYLSSRPQTERIDGPDFIQDYASQTVLRWEPSYLTVQPAFEYRYVIAALARLPAYMLEQGRFEEARFVVFVDRNEVGRGWLYRAGVPVTE